MARAAEDAKRYVSSMRRWLVFLHLALSALSALSACGGGSSGTAASGGTHDGGSGATDATTDVEPGPDGPGPDAGEASSPAGDAGAGDTGSAGGGSEGGADAGCGFEGGGTPLHVASQLELCLPPVACTSETCPPGLGQCVGGHCVFAAGYHGVATLPEAWVTYYCDLSTAGCHGVTQLEYPEITAQKVATAMSLPVCAQVDGGAATCVGISAAPPMIVGNSQLAVDQATGQPVKDWGLGLTEASGLCYQLSGPGGTVLVALTDRCGGYCSCSGSGPQECGPCVNAADMKPDCPCVGTAPPTYTSCCGATCGGPVVATCDWCASNNHPHFDLDVASFNRICGAEANLGSCKLSGVGFVHCLDASGWPP